VSKKAKAQGGRVQLALTLILKKGWDVAEIENEHSLDNVAGYVVSPDGEAEFFVGAGELVRLANKLPDLSYVDAPIEYVEDEQVQLCCQDDCLCKVVAGTTICEAGHAQVVEDTLMAAAFDADLLVEQWKADQLEPVAQEALADLCDDLAEDMADAILRQPVPDTLAEAVFHTLRLKVKAWPDPEPEPESPLCVEDEAMELAFFEAAVQAEEMPDPEDDGEVAPFWRLQVNSEFVAHALGRALAVAHDDTHWIVEGRSSSGERMVFFCNKDTASRTPPHRRRWVVWREGEPGDLRVIGSDAEGNPRFPKGVPWERLTCPPNYVRAVNEGYGPFMTKHYLAIVLRNDQLRPVLNGYADAVAEFRQAEKAGYAGYLRWKEAQAQERQPGDRVYLDPGLDAAYLRGKAQQVAM
jgi:hypothetical protein